jgi:uncharacterized protein (TIGR00730 family)
MPGGFGTLDELFEALVLVQTHKIERFPIVLFDSGFWDGALRWIRGTLVQRGTIAAQDVDLLAVTDDVGEVVRLLGDAAEAQGRSSRPAG